MLTFRLTYKISQRILTYYCIKHARDMFKSIFLSSVFAFLCFQMIAQPSGRQNRYIFDIGGGNYKTTGWHFAPGFAYTFPTVNQRNELRTTDDALNDTIYSGNFNSGGKFGLYAEFGRHHFYEKKILTYLDYGIGFKSLKGSEAFTGILNDGTEMVDYNYDEDFKNSFITGSVNFSNISQLSDFSFIQNSLGLNVDYRIINNRNPVLIETQIPEPSSLLAQVHYKLGFGFKVNRNLFVVPSIETPILNLLDWEDGKSTLGYFNTRYRPILVSVRFFWFDIQKQDDCTGAAPSTSDSDLWGKTMKKGKKKRSKRR